MKLSTTTRYGLRALSDLCAQDGDGPVAVSDIARRQDIPANYLEQLFARLRRGNILRSVRGAQGGYLLARPAGEITIAEVVDALGESIAFGDCQTEAGCKNAPDCPTFHLWRKVKNSIDEILTTTTLEALIRDGMFLGGGDVAGKDSDSL
ncbi:MAG: Rrf2 family transcriptional regulator [Fretibacterium sp.]|uniref:RrF2 family transcriptional regulator n=1 Tax=Fretibacterium sp. OH1220_COT-178 TaxID=2491047 RepID=UPI000F5D77E4|nr:Rrf2 family transcriptional regulator [Fretibacterium sp. OH1220_COT-178]MDO4785594.1 Rrf2 family transcriptional regulator [Fretibacterium sp.]RRD64612.1 Rrf2 family transcriptional regulator [Fretibacterium sp. OH1220_COT-178]